MGANISQLERDIGSDFPANERYFGLVNVSVNINFPTMFWLFQFFLNFYIFYFIIFISFSQFGNTCYSNSVLQALYFCKPFRDKVLEYKMKNKSKKESLLSCLADL